MKRRGYVWTLRGYCPECRSQYTLEESVEVSDFVRRKTYYEKMLQDNRPVAQCPECASFFESFEIKPVFIF